MKLYIPVGTTASGKTTKCREWIKNNQPAVLVEADVLRTIFLGKYTFDPKLEGMIKSLMSSCAAHWLNSGYNVAVDDAVSFLTIEQRREFEDFLDCEYNNDKLIWDFLPIPTDEEVRERRQGTERGISLEQWVEIKNQHAMLLEKEE